MLAKDKEIGYNIKAIPFSRGVCMYKRCALLCVLFLLLSGCAAAKGSALSIPAEVNTVSASPADRTALSGNAEALAAPGGAVRLFGDDCDEGKILVLWDGAQAAFDWDHVTPRGTEIASELMDLDGDGEDELVVTTLSSAGTGVNYHELHVVKRDNGTWSDLALTGDALASLTEELTYKINGTDVVFSIWTADWTVHTDSPVCEVVPVGKVVPYELSESGIRACFGVAVRYSGSPYDFYVAELLADVTLEGKSFVFSDFTWREV